MLVCFSASHRTASFDQLERLERRAVDVTTAVTAASTGSVVVSTCNRFEAYLDLPDAGIGPDAIVELIATASTIDLDALRSAATVFVGDDVPRHLFAVASGLESVVIGEGQIAGQVRKALERARAAGTVTGDLERVFRQAARASREVKNRTSLGGAGRSIVRLALELATSRVTDWSRTRVMMLGTGAYAAASLAALRDRGATDIRVFSRTGRAAAFAVSHGIDAVDADRIDEEVAAADVIVACSVSPTVILDRDLVARVGTRPGAAPRRLIIDLGLPRNVDPAVATLSGVELLDLETISLHASLDDLSALDDARAIVGGAIDEYDRKETERSIEPTLVALRQHVFGLLDDEIARARKRNSGEDTEAALRHLAGVLLHGPSVEARRLVREGRGAEFAAGVEALFGVSAPETSAVDRVEDDSTEVAS